jgi:streptomycin 6-kinase
MFAVPETFRRMPRWWHDRAGREWLEQLPGLVVEQCRRWELEIDGDPRHGSNALVIPVRRRQGPAVLRLSPPGDDVAVEAAALSWWAGRGTVRLFDVDAGSRTMLLERLSESRSLQSEPLLAAIPIIAALVRELAVPAPPDAPATAAIAAGHVATTERDWEFLGGPTARSHLDAAIELAEQLAQSHPADLAANGDLHCEQVLAADRAPWLVVDPVLLRGDPEYDFGRVLWSRLDELPTDAQVIGAFDVFVQAAGVPADRTRSWIVVRSMSYLLWGLSRGLTWDPPKCRRLLDIFC